MSILDNESVRRSIRNGKVECMDDGKIYVPDHKVVIGGVFGTAIKRDGVIGAWQHDHNLVVNEGLDSLLSVCFNAGTQITSWYVGIFEGNYTPVAGDTAATIAGNSTESTAYDEANRIAWVEAAPSGQSITNTASKATFTMNATKTIYGAFLVSTNTKGGTTGTLMAASRFSASRSVVDDDELLLTYTFSAADA